MSETQERISAGSMRPRQAEMPAKLLACVSTAIDNRSDSDVFVTIHE